MSPPVLNASAEFIFKAGLRVFGVRSIGYFVLYKHASVRPIAFHYSCASLRSFSACVRIQGELDRTRAEPLPKRRKRASSRSYDIPVWGELVVYTSPNEASGTLEADEVDEQYVRLIQVADNAQLRLMLKTGVELCGGDAALYVRVDPTCPIYWVRWDNRKSKADLDVVCDIPHRGVRATMLEKVQFNADSTGVVKIRHARNKPSETSTSSSLGALLVSTACGRIVGSKTFPRRSPRGNESGDEEKDEEEDKED